MPPGADFGNLLGTAIAVVFFNVWATRTGRPTSIVPVPSIFLLVSGTIGFRGLASLASGGIVLSEQEIVHVSGVALTIGDGLVVGRTISPPGSPSDPRVRHRWTGRGGPGRPYGHGAPTEHLSPRR